MNGSPQWYQDIKALFTLTIEVAVFDIVTLCVKNGIELYPAHFKWYKKTPLTLESEGSFIFCGSESDVASRWVHKESNLMFTLSSDEYQR